MKTLEEFCLELSKRVRKPTLIAGFEASMKARGLTQAPEQSFETAFIAFTREKVQ